MTERQRSITEQMTMKQKVFNIANATQEVGGNTKQKEKSLVMQGNAENLHSAYSKKGGAGHPHITNLDELFQSERSRKCHTIGKQTKSNFSESKQSQILKQDELIEPQPLVLIHSPCKNKYIPMMSVSESPQTQDGHLNNSMRQDGVYQSEFNDGNHQEDLTSNFFVLGNNSKGQLGLGSHTELPEFLEIPHSIKFDGIQVNLIACGDHHTLFATKQGYIYAMGSNKHGQLGIGTDTYYKNAIAIQNQQTMSFESPILVETLQEWTPRQISCSKNATMCLMTNGEVFTWGGYKHGVLGLGDLVNEKMDQFEPQKLLLDSEEELIIKQIDMGKYHAGLIASVKDSQDENNYLYMWGRNDQGQLGVYLQDGSSSIDSPMKVDINFNPEMLTCGNDFTVIKSVDQNIFQTGSIQNKVTKRFTFSSIDQDCKTEVLYQFNQVESDLDNNKHDMTVTQLQASNYCVIQAEDSNGLNKIYVWGKENPFCKNLKITEPTLLDNLIRQSASLNEQGVLGDDVYINDIKIGNGYQKGGKQQYFGVMNTVNRNNHCQESYSFSLNPETDKIEFKHIENVFLEQFACGKDFMVGISSQMFIDQQMMIHMSLYPTLMPSNLTTIDEANQQHEQVEAVHQISASVNHMTEPHTKHNSPFKAQSNVEQSVNTNFNNTYLQESKSFCSQNTSVHHKKSQQQNLQRESTQILRQSEQKKQNESSIQKTEIEQDHDEIDMEMQNLIQSGNVTPVKKEKIIQDTTKIDVQAELNKNDSTIQEEENKLEETRKDVLEQRQGQPQHQNNQSFQLSETQEKRLQGHLMQDVSASLACLSNHMNSNFIMDTESKQRPSQQHFTQNNYNGANPSALYNQQVPNLPLQHLMMQGANVAASQILDPNHVFLSQTLNLSHQHSQLQQVLQSARKHNDIQQENQLIAHLKEQLQEKDAQLEQKNKQINKLQEGPEGISYYKNELKVALKDLQDCQQSMEAQKQDYLSLTQSKDTQIDDLRAQLSSLHQQLKDLRSQQSNQDQEFIKKIQQLNTENMQYKAQLATQDEELAQSIQSLKEDLISKETSLKEVNLQIDEVKKINNTLESHNEFLKKDNSSLQGQLDQMDDACKQQEQKYVSLQIRYNQLQEEKIKLFNENIQKNINNVQDIEVLSGYSPIELKRSMESLQTYKKHETNPNHLYTLKEDSNSHQISTSNSNSGLTNHLISQENNPKTYQTIQPLLQDRKQKVPFNIQKLNLPNKNNPEDDLLQRTQRANIQKQVSEIQKKQQDSSVSKRQTEDDDARGTARGGTQVCKIQLKDQQQVIEDNGQGQNSFVSGITSQTDGFTSHRLQFNQALLKSSKPQDPVSQEVLCKTHRQTYPKTQTNIDPQVPTTKALQQDTSAITAQNLPSNTRNIDLQQQLAQYNHDEHTFEVSQSQNFNQVNNETFNENTTQQQLQQEQTATVSYILQRDGNNNQDHSEEQSGDLTTSLADGGLHKMQSRLQSDNTTSQLPAQTEEHTFNNENEYSSSCVTSQITQSQVECQKDKIMRKTQQPNMMINFNKQIQFNKLQDLSSNHQQHDDSSHIMGGGYATHRLVSNTKNCNLHEDTEQKSSQLILQDTSDMTQQNNDGYNTHRKQHRRGANQSGKSSMAKNLIETPTADNNFTSIQTSKRKQGSITHNYINNNSKHLIAGNSRYDCTNTIDSPSQITLTQRGNDTLLNQNQNQNEISQNTSNTIIHYQMNSHQLKQQKNLSHQYANGNRLSKQSNGGLTPRVTNVLENIKRGVTGGKNHCKNAKVNLTNASYMSKTPRMNDSCSATTDQSHIQHYSNLRISCSQQSFYDQAHQDKNNQKLVLQRGGSGSVLSTFQSKLRQPTPIKNNFQYIGDLLAKQMSRTPNKPIAEQTNRFSELQSNGVSQSNHKTHQRQHYPTSSKLNNILSDLEYQAQTIQGPSHRSHSKQYNMNSKHTPKQQSAQSYYASGTQMNTGKRKHDCSSKSTLQSQGNNTTNRQQNLLSKQTQQIQQLSSNEQPKLSSRVVNASSKSQNKVGGHQHANSSGRVGGNAKTTHVLHTSILQHNMKSNRNKENNENSFSTKPAGTTTAKEGRKSHGGTTTTTSGKSQVMETQLKSIQLSKQQLQQKILEYEKKLSYHIRQQDKVMKTQGENEQQHPLTGMYDTFNLVDQNQTLRASQQSLHPAGVSKGHQPQMSFGSNSQVLNIQIQNTNQTMINNPPQIMMPMEGSKNASGHKQVYIEKLKQSFDKENNAFY